MPGFTSSVSTVFQQKPAATARPAAVAHIIDGGMAAAEASGQVGWALKAEANFKQRAAPADGWAALAQLPVGQPV